MCHIFASFFPPPPFLSQRSFDFDDKGCHRVHSYRIRQNPTKIRKTQSLGTTEAGGVLLTNTVLILSHFLYPCLLRVLEWKLFSIFLILTL